MCAARNCSLELGDNQGFGEAGRNRVGEVRRRGSIPGIPRGGEYLSTLGFGGGRAERLCVCVLGGSLQ